MFLLREAFSSESEEHHKGQVGVPEEEMQMADPGTGVTLITGLTIGVIVAVGFFVVELFDVWRPKGGT